MTLSRARALSVPALLFAGVLALASTPALADTVRTMTVTGQGEAFGTPDIATISAGVESQAKTAAQALSDNAQAMNAVFAALKHIGIPDKNIQTSGFSVQPQYTQFNSSEAQRIVGYQVSNQVTVIIEGTQKVGPAIDALVAAGANQMNNVSFSIRDPQGLLTKAREAAVADAIGRAQVLAKAAHVTLGPITSIEEENSGGIQPMAVMGAMMRANATPVAAGQQKIQASVSITWEIK